MDETGERMDENSLGDSVQEVNSLTVIASESYEEFASTLQNEYYEDSSGRVRKITPDLFEGRVLKKVDGTKIDVDKYLALDIYVRLIDYKYVDDYKLTESFYDDKKAGALNLGEEYNDYQDSIIGLLDRIYDRDIDIINERARNVYARVNEDKLYSKEFKELWSRINRKTYYTVKFSSNDLIENCIARRLMRN